FQPPADSSRLRPRAAGSAASAAPGTRPCVQDRPAPRPCPPAVSDRHAAHPARVFHPSLHHHPCLSGPFPAVRSFVTYRSIFGSLYQSPMRGFSNPRRIRAIATPSGRRARNHTDRVFSLELLLIIFMLLAAWGWLDSVASREAAIKL